MEQLGLMPGIRYCVRFALLASSISLVISPVFCADPVINSVNDGRIVKDGTYLNTTDGVTTFRNSGSGGLWLKSDSTVRALEVDASGKLTNNGGSVHFYAPNSVVRIDGTVNANALLDGKGAYLGNGGKVFVDSAYLFQSGQIYANGINGGLVQMNVGSMTLAPGGGIQAKGMGGNGGVIAINADGLVSLGTNTLLDSSGKVAGRYDGNLINIEGGAIRVAGELRANGVVVGNTDGSRGGTIRLVASGNTHLGQASSAIDDGTQRSAGDLDSTPTVSATEAAQWKNSNTQAISGWDGNIVISGHYAPNNGIIPVAAKLSANGSSGTSASNNDTVQDPSPRAGDGGTIIISAMNDVINFGTVSANGGHGVGGSTPVNGGNGGTIGVVSQGNIVNWTLPGLSFSGRFLANGGNGQSSALIGQNGGNGGKGGLLAFGYNGTFMNDSLIQAKGGIGYQGGQGGLMVFSGDGNPFGKGIIDANGGQSPVLNLLTGGAGGSAGVIVAPDPTALKNRQIVFQTDGGYLSGDTVLWGAMRPVNQQTAENELLTNAENLILLTRNAPAGTLSPTLGKSIQSRGKDAIIRSVNDSTASGSAQNEIIAKEAFAAARPYRNFLLSSNANGLRLNLNKEPALFRNDFEVNLYGLNTLTVLNDGYVTNTGSWDVSSWNNMGGGRISILASGDIENGTGLTTAGQYSGGSIHLASKGSVRNYNLLGALMMNDGKGVHGGSIMLKANQDIENRSFNSIVTNGALIGGTQRFNANRKFLNLGDIAASTFSSAANSNTTGGNINIRAAESLQNGENFAGAATINAQSLVGPQGHGGTVRIDSPNKDMEFGQLNVDGSQSNGEISIH